MKKVLLLLIKGANQPLFALFSNWLPFQVKFSQLVRGLIDNVWVRCVLIDFGKFEAICEKNSKVDGLVILAHFLLVLDSFQIFGPFLQKFLCFSKVQFVSCLVS